MVVQVHYTIYLLILYVKVFNYTFNNIPAISWPSVLLTEETEVTGETTELPQFTGKVYHTKLYRVHHIMSRNVNSKL